MKRAVMCCSGRNPIKLKLVYPNPEKDFDERAVRLILAGITQDMRVQPRVAGLYIHAAVISVKCSRVKVITFIIQHFKRKIAAIYLAILDVQGAVWRINCAG